jgi:hypothetical protein
MSVTQCFEPHSPDSEARHFKETWMSFLTKSLAALAVASTTLLAASAQTNHWPRTTVPTTQPCPPTVMPSYPIVTPGQQMPNMPNVPSVPNVPPMSQIPGGNPPPTPFEGVLPSPLNGQVSPTPDGIGERTAFVDRGGSSGLDNLTPMIGDLGLGGFVETVIVLPNGSTSLVRQPRVIRTAAPLVTRNSFKIQENESPRPVDRIFGAYNYFNDLRLNDGADRLDLHRQTIGFEKTFLNRRASFGVRLPFIQTNGGFLGGESGIGDLSLIGKYVLRENYDRGNLLTLGAVVTVPTSSNFPNLGITSQFDTVVLQPWLGSVFNFENFYIQTITSLAVPTDSEQTTFLFNSLGINYRLYRSDSDDATIRFIVPTIEGHLTTPLNNRTPSATSSIIFPDIFVSTFGAHVGLGRRTVLTTAIGVPLTGPRPFAFEGVLQLNLLF